MVHVADISAGLEWFGRAFPNAQRMGVENSDFEFLAGLTFTRMASMASSDPRAPPGGKFAPGEDISLSSTDQTLNFFGLHHRNTGRAGRALSISRWSFFELNCQRVKIISITIV